MTNEYDDIFNDSTEEHFLVDIKTGLIYLLDEFAYSIINTDIIEECYEIIKFLEDYVEEIIINTEDINQITATFKPHKNTEIDIKKEFDNYLNLFPINFCLSKIRQDAKYLAKDGKIRIDENYFEVFKVRREEFKKLKQIFKAQEEERKAQEREFKDKEEREFRAKEEKLKAKEEKLKAKEKEFKAKEKEAKSKGKFKRSGHLSDQILKYDYPKNKQPSLFDNLQSETLKSIEVAGVERSEIVEGIKLSPSETKVIDCLCKLLHENSQNLNPEKEDYYTGIEGYHLTDYGEEKDTPAPKLAFTLYELTKEYKGGENIGGKDVEIVKQILTDLDNKRFLLSYVEKTRKKDGTRVEKKIEDFRKLIHIIKITETEYTKEDIELSKKEDTIIILNPIFRRQIDSKFILYPNDINKRTIIAYGSHNLSDIAMRLRDYLMRELSSKHYQPEISMDKLYYLLAEKWMKESRRKKVKQDTEKALETVTALGLLLSYNIVTASTGEPKIVFQLDKNWE
jgi:hypothetical protein